MLALPVAFPALVGLVSVPAAPRCDREGLQPRLAYVPLRLLVIHAQEMRFKPSTLLLSRSC